MGEASDRETFNRLIVEHLAAAQRFAIRLTGDPELAEEIVQEALLRAAKGWRSFTGRSRFKTWLLQIVINAFRDHLRRRKHREELPDQLPDAATGPPETAMAGEMGEIVAAKVSNLPPRQREVLVLIAYEQTSIREAAAMLGISEENVRANLHVARRRLREQLGPYLEQSHERR